MAVMFLPQGDAPPDTHKKGHNILPKSTDAAPLPPLREILGLAGRTDVVRTEPVKKSALEELTQRLPGDIPIVKETPKT